MRQRRAVLYSLPRDGEWMPLGAVLRSAAMLKRPFEAVVDTLLAEEQVERAVGTDGKPVLRRLPEPQWETATGVLTAPGRRQPGPEQAQPGEAPADARTPVGASQPPEAPVRAPGGNGTHPGGNGAATTPTATASTPRTATASAQPLPPGQYVPPWMQ